MNFAVEKWATFHADVQPLLPVHYDELALDKERMKLGIDAKRYEEADHAGVLLIATARDEKKLVGYLIAMLVPHLHYKDSGLMAYTDLYFLHPDYRRGGCGARFLIFVEECLRKAGIVKAYISTKIHQDNGALFEALGWRASDRIFTKVLG